ncbi:hypothetical protein BS17DRAFT_876945 [Gyrodon lividus]|nr:hypothetical protein BS17DRAFT_876945 [Gyrodon lividus]
MANALLVCDSGTSWYSFSHSLSRSNDCKIEKLLSDIPPISVGILLFGVSVLLLAIKRVTLSAVWLYFSVFLAFAAAILDLGQTLADDMSTSTAIIKAREVLFALSTGLRFLFYWSYVAEPPRKVLPATLVPEGQGTSFLILESSHEIHSGSWIRWGLPGTLLRSGLLVAIAAITALQIVWRIVPQFHRYSNVYATDTAFELLASVLLLLKLLLNTVTPNSPDSPHMHTFGECIAPISGLLINIALGVGSLLRFAFTESTFGRLLQAVEGCTIVVFVMVIALLKYRNSLILIHASPKTIEPNLSLPDPERGSTFRVTPPVVETPRVSMVFGATTTGRGALRLPARRSLTRVSSWVPLTVSRNRLGNEDDQAKLWEQGEAENRNTGHSHLRASPVSLTENLKDWAELVHDAAASHMSIFSAVDAQSTRTTSREGSRSSGQILHAFRADVAQRRVRLRLRMSSSSAPAAPFLSPDSQQASSERAIIMTAPADSRAQDSPTYGLEGIIRPPPSQPPARDSGMSLDELLRQQNELDKSIMALKLFSKRTSVSSSTSSQIRTQDSTEMTRFSSSTGRRTASDVSLSNFPLPSWLTSPVPLLPSSRLPPIIRMREDRRARLPATVVSPTTVLEQLLPPPKLFASLADIPRSPRSESVSDSPLRGDNESLSAAAGRPPRFNSGGTQYNVTSFIGDLATPGGHRRGSLEKPWQSTESEINLAAIINGPDWRETTPRMLPVPLTPPSRQERLLTLPAKAKPSPLSISARLSQGGSSVVEPAPTAQHQFNPQLSKDHLHPFTDPPSSPDK